MQYKIQVQLVYKKQLKIHIVVLRIVTNSMLPPYLGPEVKIV
jgi:hypothetical protein